jgi:hypothetical protein
MPKSAAFEETFAALRGILAPYATQLLVTADTPGNYQLCSRTLKDRIGRPLFVAAVQIKKAYVSYHLMPVYSAPQLLKGLSPALKKRMQGKSCFNFTTIDPAQVKELSALTKTGIEAFKDIKLPWVQSSQQQ